jgi:zinc/manganese transport system ATP-binding protein
MTTPALSAPAMTAPAVVLSSVTAGYPGRPLWSGLDLRLAAGEFLTVLGRNGTGKTTLLRLVLGQLAPVAGTVQVLGEPVRRGHARVGYTPQQRIFDTRVPLRGVDLVRLGIDGHRWGPGRRCARAAAAVAAAVDAVGATDYATAPVGRLSGGQQQRLRIAQALVGDPHLLLLDEPLASLDPTGTAQIAALLDHRRRAAETAVVVVTHDVNPVLAHTDRVLYLGPRGTWVVGPPARVLTSDTLTHLHGEAVHVTHVHGHVVIVGGQGTAPEPSATPPPAGTPAGIQVGRG